MHCFRHSVFICPVSYLDYCLFVAFIFYFNLNILFMCMCVVYMCASVYVPICGHMDICRSKVDIASLARMFFTLFIEIRYLT